MIFPFTQRVDRVDRVILIINYSIDSSNTQKKKTLKILKWYVTEI